MAQQFGVEFKQNRNFFDRAAVIKTIGKANATALSRHGAFVQRRARSSMKRRKKPSPPGSPPSCHSSDPVATLKNIWFAYEPSTQSVVVGPLRLNGSGGSVPALHEFGGRRTIRELLVRGRWVPESTIGRRNRQRFRSRTRSARYPARPFMGPAGQAEIKSAPNIWGTTGRAA